MRIFFFSLIFLLSFAAFPQAKIKTSWDSTLRSGMKEYITILKKADIYLFKSQAILDKVSFYKQESRNYLDSANVAARKAPIERANSQFYIMQFNFLFDQSCANLKKADTLLLEANKYRDTANIINKEAEAFFLTLAEKYEKDFKNDTTTQTVYVIQIASGNLPFEYFNKLTNVEVITPNDGLTRFIVGRYYTTEDAKAAKKKFIDLGYKDSFIRTIKSLDF